MSFTTQIFTFFLMPASLLTSLLLSYLERHTKAGDTLRRLRLQDLLLIAFSMCFYAWAWTMHLLVLIAVNMFVFLTGILLEKTRARKSGRILLTGAVLILIGGLFAVKYIPGLISFISGGTYTAHHLSLLSILGISFITFTAVSYLTDIYRGDAKPGNLIDCMLYLLFFPKIVSGQIVLWKEFAPQIRSRTVTAEDAASGMNRIMIGFVKKLILADSFGLALSQMALGGMDRVTVVFSMLLYMLQIYYDFSGYSDIAIGLSRMFGFRFKENFSFPYRARSISEFWRRWHISLGAWFREYVYFPLGGSRTSRRKTLRNLAAVFLLTGIWHGAGLNYLLWGVINGIFVIVERLIANTRAYKKTPDWVKWLITMNVVLCFWQLFRFESVKQVAWLFKDVGKVPYTWQYYLSDMRLVTLTLIAMAGATLFGIPRVHALHEKLTGTPLGYLVQELLLLVLFVIAILFMVNSTYSPFIYFRY